MNRGDDTFLKDYATNWINAVLRELSSDQKGRLISIAIGFIEGKYTYEAAYSMYAKIYQDCSLIIRINAIMQISPRPLPSYQESINNLILSKRKKRKQISPWTYEEDNRLIAGMNILGPHEWRAIAEFVGNSRESAQCSQRWSRVLNPIICHTPWTKEEDEKLLNAIELMGQSMWNQSKLSKDYYSGWCHIAKLIDGRTDLQCRYRYLQLLRIKKLREQGLSRAREKAEDSTIPQPEINSSADNEESSIETPPPIGFTQVLSNSPPMNFTLLPYYLDDQLKPRFVSERNQDMLHRFPPLLFARKSK